jgi:uncharacterized membrane protein YphA (DoxX/SURF4 family)
LRLQRLYVTFPAGRPGVGLLLLRAALGATAFGKASLYLSAARPDIDGSSTMGLAAGICGVLLIVGFLTPLASAVYGLSTLAAAFSWLPDSEGFLGGTWCLALLIAISAAMVLLGPGANSVDARLFGRREIIIPPRNSQGQ